MLRTVRSDASRSIIYRVFNLIAEIFDGLVGVVRSAEEGVIVLEIIRQDISVYSVEMIEDGTGGGGTVSHVFMTERTDEHINQGGEENLAEGFVSAIILVEECSSNAVRIAEFGDLGACGGI